MNICLFSSDEIGKPLDINDERGKHILKILHKKVGESFSAGVIGGKAGKATITAININDSPDNKFKTGTINYTFTEESDGKPLYPLSLIIGFPRPIQLKRLMRDVASLGACSLHLTGTELGEKSYLQSTLVQKGAAYQMLLDGSVQAASTHVPELFMHQNLRESLESIKSEYKDKKTLFIALDNINPKMSLVDLMKEHSDVEQVVAAIGSERGWSEKEREKLEREGFIRCGMGIRILRTETAATVASSLILASMGYLS